MFLFMRKMIFFAVMMAMTVTCAANNVCDEPKTVANENTVEEVLKTIDGNIWLQSTYINENREVFIVEYGQRFIRVRDFKTHKLVATISISVAKDIDEWIDGANTVMYDSAKQRFVPARGIETSKGIIYRSAKHRQYVPNNRIASLRQELRIPIQLILNVA